MKRHTKLVFWLVLLTVFDIVATYIGLQTGVVTEANPLADWLLNWSWFGGWAIIVAWQAFWIWMLADNIKEYHWMYHATLFLIGVKTTIAYFHIYWITIII